MLKVNHLSVLLLICITLTTILGCRRTPINLQHGRKTRGDNGYKIIIGSTTTGYVPGQTYSIFLLGSQTHNNIQHFTNFMLTAEATNGSGRAIVASPKRVGRFQLFSDSLTKFNENCVNTIMEYDDLPKTEIQVMWIAPATGSGCVSLSAMVYENQRSWFADDGNLTKIICEEKNNNPEVAKKECCACDEAKYTFIFEGIWTNETHPKDFPPALWLTHFSDVIGASHETNFSFWGENHLATDGFRSLAEWGSPTALETELRTKGSKLRSLIKAPGLWYPDVNTNTSSNFRVDRKHHKISLASMLGPSPDWVVGVSGLDLCLEDCTWKDQMDIDLFPWDAGTDSGISYMSPNAETIPRERMYKITTMYPEDPRAPFYNPNSDKMNPLARLYIRREKVISRNCDDEFLNAIQTNIGENSAEENTPVECEVSEYTQWTSCSVTCGKGLRMRTRSYLRPNEAKSAKCTRQLISKEMCVADIPDCGEQSSSDDDEGENLAISAVLVNEQGEGVGVCTTTPWAEWSECSATCGIGISMRTRTFINHQGRKKCPHVSVVEKQKCMRPDCTFVQEELPDPKCPVSLWSDWSPCTTTCGRGVSIRTRLLLVEPSLHAECSTRKELYQQKQCSIREDCIINSEIAREICLLDIDVGPCRGVYSRYAYNHETKSCQPFNYGGCRGNRNNFLTTDDCMKTCQLMEDNHQEVHSRTAPQSPPPPQDNTNRSEDCVLSDWSDWSPCSVTCGLGLSTRTRTIIRQSPNTPCTKRTFKRKRCLLQECRQ